MQLVIDDADSDPADPATLRRVAPPEGAGDDDADVPVERETPAPEEEGYGYGV